MNDGIKLETQFKMSFVVDICKGMAYMHGNKLHSHGNLKSSNCVVDARWNVKVSFFFVFYLCFFCRNPEIAIVQCIPVIYSFF